MTAEAQVLGPGGKRVVAATATRNGDQRLDQGAQITRKSAAPIADYRAGNFRMRLDQLRGVAPPVALQEQR